MGISLYTSRIILKVLGIDDFGIYNLVAGVVILFSFINNSLSASTQRFINFEKASLVKEKVNKIFNITIVNHILISILLIIISETIGVWFLNNYLNIPTDRINSANILFQICILTTVIEIIRVPYNSLIIAYERMSFYAYLSIFESISKLFIALTLIYIKKFDNLIFYGILLLFVNLLVTIIYIYYCKIQFKIESKLKFYKDYEKIKELFMFSGWMLLGQLSVIASTQGISIVFNIFLGVVINATIGIANQVNGAIYSFVSNFQVAFNPQIIQSLALKEINKHKDLVLTTSKFSFFLIMIISGPILYFTNTILTFWLGNILPEYAVSFVQIVILCSIIDALGGPFWMSVNAIGNIKKYNLVIAFINLLTLPIFYILLNLEYNPKYIFATKFIISILIQIFRFYYLNKTLNFEKSKLLNYLYSISIGFIILLLLLLLSNNIYIQDLGKIFMDSILIEVSIFVFIVLLGLNSSEKKHIYHFILKKIKK